MNEFAGDEQTPRITAGDAVLLRRAATAARNVQRQAAGEADWFDWVPAYLENLADSIDKEQR